MTLRELKIITKKPHSNPELYVDRFYARRLSIYLTWLLLPTPLTANQVTVLSMVLMLGGSALFGFVTMPMLLLGVGLMQMGYLLDCCDGEIARARGTTSLRGIYLDTLAHAFTIPAMFFAAGTGLALRNNTPETLAFGAIAAIAGTYPATRAKDVVRQTQHRDLPTAAPPNGDTCIAEQANTRNPKRIYLNTIGRLTLFPNSMFVLHLAVLVHLSLWLIQPGNTLVHGPLYFTIAFYALVMSFEQVAAAVSWSREKRLKQETQ